MDIPSVVIVGRPNVGKSSLFNALCRSRVAIVEPTPGVTRDRISRVVEWDGAAFELVDTGGMGLHDSEELAADIQAQIHTAIDRADLVLLVVDAREGLQPSDAEIADRLRDAGKEVTLVVNKCDSPREEDAAADFYQLGFPEFHRTAAVHRRGVSTLLDSLVAAFPRASGAAGPAPGESAPAEPLKIAFVGRRNVGKSTLINHLAREPRVVVSETPGTTRDAVDVRFQMGDLDFIAIDTAGLRRRKQIKDSIDYYSSVRSHDSIRRADVVVHMMEAPMEVGRLDRQIVGEVIGEHKPCVLAVNKMDLAPGVSHAEFEQYVRSRLPGVAFAPVAFISAVTGENVTQLIHSALALHEQSFVQVRPSDINRVIQAATKRNRPPSMKSRFTRIFYATQVAVQPPTVALFVNEPSLLSEAYLRYLANRLRAEFAFNAIPIRLVLRGRQPDAKDR